MPAGAFLNLKIALLSSNVPAGAVLNLKNIDVNVDVNIDVNIDVNKTVPPPVGNFLDASQVTLMST